MTHPFPTRRSSDLLVAKTDRADRGLQPGQHVLDQRLVDHHVDAHRIGIGNANDRLSLANQRALFNDEFLVTPTVGNVSIFHDRSEEHTSELQSLMRISYAVFCLKKKKTKEE